MKTKLIIPFVALVILLPGVALAQECEQKSVDAKGGTTIFNVDPGVSYTVTAQGTFYDGSGRQDADPKYAGGINTSWFDVPPGSQQLGSDHLELFMNGSRVDWGSFNPYHEYSISKIFSSEQATFKIVDLGSSADNGGSLIVELCKNINSSAKPIEQLSFGKCESKFLSAKGLTTTFKSLPGVSYKVTSSGVFDAGNFWVFADAKYSRWIDPNPTTWTDFVRSYESLGSKFLELHINGVAPDWGTFSADHNYSVLYTSLTDSMAFSIYDTAHGNNTGGLTITVCPVMMSDIEAQEYVDTICGLNKDCACVNATLGSLSDEGRIDHRIYASISNACHLEELQSSYDDGFTAGVASVPVETIKSESYSQGFEAGKNAVQCPVDSGNKEKEGKKKITICHFAANGKGNTISISENAWQAHQKHGDVLGECPKAEEKSKDKAKK